jgi:diguanylate cyclase (GGDEF)-like protein
VRIEQLALLLALVIAANVVLFLALQLPFQGRRRRGSRRDAAPGAIGEGGTRLPAPAPGGTRARPSGDGGSGLPAALYQRVTRIVSFMFIAAAMTIVVLTGAANQTAIIVLLAFGLLLVALFEDVLPPASLGRWRLPLEVAAALVFLTVLISVTGGQDSPYFFGYVLLVGGAALSASGAAAALLAVVSSSAYMAAIALADPDQPLLAVDLGQIAFNLVVIALVMYVGSVIGREQRRARDEALRLSRFDSLTTLFSRDYFVAELEQEILRATRTGRPFALAMIDLDGLKSANDRFGHEWGDNLLRAVAEVLRGAIRATDAAARYGGDEFVLLLPETDLAGAVRVAEKVRVDVSRVALPHDGAVVRTSASIGIVAFPDDGRTSAELMRRADLAMYEAKRRGRDQIVRFAREDRPAPDAPRMSHRYPITSAGAAVGPGPAPAAPAVDAPRADEPALPPLSPGRPPWEKG